VSATALQVTILLAIGAGLTLYVLLGGADFGGGVWDMLARGSTRERERALIGQAIAPVWEANHVWLIFVVTALLAAFPSAFADLGVALYLPFGIAIGGIVLRGSAFAFRAHGDPGSAWQRRWTRVFGIASLVTPVVLGMCAGAIACGRIRVADGAVHAGLVSAWTGPVSWAAGLLALAMCAYLAATYLTVEADQRGDDELVRRYRRGAFVAGLAAGALAAIGLLAIRAGAPVLWSGMLQDGWPFVLASAIAGTVALAATVRGRERITRAAAAVAVAAVVAGWGVAQWPYLIVPDVTAADAAAPAASLRAIAIGCVVGGVLLAPSLLLLFRVFKRASASPPSKDGAGAG